MLRRKKNRKKSRKRFLKPPPTFSSLSRPFVVSVSFFSFFSSFISPSVRIAISVGRGRALGPFFFFFPFSPFFSLFFPPLAFSLSQARDARARHSLAQPSRSLCGASALQHSLQYAMLRRGAGLLREGESAGRGKEGRESRRCCWGGLDFFRVLC